MKEKGIFFIIFGVFLAITLISANSYVLEYNQIEDKLVIRELVNNIQIVNQVSPDLLEKSSEGYYFVKKVRFNQSYSEAEIKLNLDTGFILEKDGVFPANYETETDGQTISVVWKLSNVDSGDVFPMFVKIKNSGEDYTSLWLGSLVILMLIIAYLMYRKKKHNKTSTNSINPRIAKSEKMSEAYSYLLDTEKKVIEELKKADRNELWQRQIQNSTGFSKAKVSRLVRNLETRGFITKIPFGNTNKVRLKL